MTLMRFIYVNRGGKTSNPPALYGYKVHQTHM